MAYTLVLPHDTQTEIRAYIEERFSELDEQLEALTAIRTELDKLAANPALGSPQYGGPFERRPIYQFSISVGGTIRTIRVAYFVHKKDKVVAVTGFTPIAL